MALREDCEINDCGLPRFERQWCSRHYSRWRNHGDPLGGGPYRYSHLTAEERFWMKVDASGDCWIWTATTNQGGYGTTANGIASRAAWEFLIGPIPEGMTVDHRCYNPPCVNPDHLQLLTRSENAKATRYTQRNNAAKTHCPPGPPLRRREHLPTTGEPHPPDVPRVHEGERQEAGSQAQGETPRG